MHIDLQRLLNYLLLSLSICGGLVAGLLAGRLVDLSLDEGALLVPKTQGNQASVRQLQAKDFQQILDRNLFDSQASGGGQIDLSLANLPGQAATVVRSNADLQLIGTVVAGDGSLALVMVGRKAGVYRLNDSLASGVVLIEISRNMVAVRDQGVRRELLIKSQTGKPTTNSQRATNLVMKNGIATLGNNRWQVSRSAVEQARSNFNSLLQTARVIPQLNNGQTIGFKLVELEKDSLLGQIGLQVGDLLVEVNQLPLNSPEKALQIFQQIREANNISLGLVRNGTRETFEYSFE